VACKEKIEKFQGRRRWKERRKGKGKGGRLEKVGRNT
jgi:hypothetical protein